MVVKIKMEGMLYHCALALQEYNFEIEYNPGSQNANADALFAYVVEFISHRLSRDSLYQAQRNDPLISQL